ncbi:MAG: nicotinate-nucleotide adenylyltransferase [Bryocella sp.]
MKRLSTLEWMRIGYFGGSFDPPHRGHLHVAQAAAERFALERVLLAPTGSQPLKPDGPTASFADRLSMVRLLVEAQKYVEASEIDAPREDGAPNYTVDTLVRLRETLDAKDDLFVVVGIDAFAEIRRWRDPERLFELAQWIVVSRPGFDVAAVETLGLTRKEREQVHVMDDVAEDVSASALRRMLAADEDVAAILPVRVLEFIRAHGLYGASR